MLALLVLVGLSLGIFHINQAICRRQAKLPRRSPQAWRGSRSARSWPRL